MLELLENAELNWLADACQGQSIFGVSLDEL